MMSARLACAWLSKEGESLVSMWKVWRTLLKEARRMMPERRKEIWRDQASWSSVGSRCFAIRDRMRFIGSVVEDVNAVGSGEGKRSRRSVVRDVVRMR